ncbi:hypothetical protein P153DRAFT_349752 [Dothidotthia symphoricarpi CBS 119687]|uniref:Uncharacterized protein n=1 Tax=Dothidotthia symphoricarpi CBS 119687 TaxID=1392245 RepID=A0A6A6A081_9PLEO|nr:uncharacterized protein P153DRAFT_349752 [Dothidotthia symphoricarpi CBS 119687]KAF2124655.1 hypothetical protein P153DRAFT_349752 [Dothidotthia symphoricarpi CBS 119687]
MIAQGDLQEQLSKILAAANSAGLKFEDVIPDEMADYFQGMTQLKAAQDYIKDLEFQQTQLSAENSKLTAKLKAAEEEIENQPEEFKEMKVELQQANRQADCWQKCYEDALTRVETYQRQLQERLQPRFAVDDDSVKKIERLKHELDQQKAINAKLVQENQVASALFEALQPQYAREVEEKDVELRRVVKELDESQATIAAIESENEQVSDTCNVIIEFLESENENAAKAIQHHSTNARDANRLCSVIRSEITPLNTFFSYALAILDTYRSVFQALAAPYAHTFPATSTLDKDLDAAADHLEFYRVMHQATQIEGEVDDSVRTQVNEVAGKAGEMYLSLDRMKVDVEKIMEMRRRHPVGKNGKRRSFFQRFL